MVVLGIILIELSSGRTAEQAFEDFESSSASAKSDYDVSNYNSLSGMILLLKPLRLIVLLLAPKIRLFRLLAYSFETIYLTLELVLPTGQVDIRSCGRILMLSGAMNMVFFGINFVFCISLSIISWTAVLLNIYLVQKADGNLWLDLSLGSVFILISAFAVNVAFSKRGSGPETAQEEQGGPNNFSQNQW